ncbi:MAG: hypothetical protein WBP29_08340 [Candidatus Zixiibacteriota bacterium]
MNKKVSLMFVAAIVIAAAAFLVAEEKPWLDMANCDFCKPWTENGLMTVVAQEQVPISNGALCLSTVPEARMAEYKKTSALMNEIADKATKGEPVKMCGSCETMGSFFMRGAKMEEAWTKTGSVMLITSSDSTVVADIHKWVKKNDEEFAKMMKPAADTK